MLIWPRKTIWTVNRRESRSSGPRPVAVNFHLEPRFGESLFRDGLRAQNQKVDLE